MPGPFLATKTHIPRLRRALVSRPRLLTRLTAGLTCPLTLIAAPAGFGKTTLLGDLCEWLAKNGCPASWVSLDDGDDDPARFWAYVIASLEAIRPGLGSQAMALLEEGQPGGMEPVMAALVNALDALPGDAILVLDDYHVIANEQIHRSLAYLVDHLPQQIHIYLTTRADPPLPLARWRARGLLNEVRTADLRFTPDEAGQFLTATMDLRLSPDEVVALRTRTEGWVAGLQLAALALRAQDPAQVAHFVAASAGSSRFVVDYLVDEVLARQSAGVQDFLRQTAILDHLTAPLCDRVTGRQDSQAVLEQLERANLFITPTDGERRWYRYHTLFADLLRKLLGQAQPELVPELHRRACGWYEEHEFLPEAIGHALAGRDYVGAALLIERVARSTLQRGELSILAGWLAALPPAELSARPLLCVFRARTLIAGGDFDGVEALLAAAESQVPAGLTTTEAAALRGHIASVRAMLAAQVADVPAMIAQGREALRHLPADRAFLRDLSAWIEGLAYVLSGQEAAAGWPLREAIGRHTRGGGTLLVLLSTYAFGLLEMTQGRLALAGELYERALQHLAGRDPLPESAGLVYLGLGELCRARGDLDAAAEYLNQGLALVRRRGDPNAPIQGLISLAWVGQARGDSAAAAAALQEAGRLALGKTLPRTIVQLRAHTARLALRQNNLATAERWAADNRLPGGAAPAGDLAGQYLHQVVQSTWARLLLARGQPGEAIAALAPLRDQALRAGWVRVLITLDVVTALAAHAAGEAARALAALGEALTLAEPEGYVGPFVDEGPAVVGLLAEGLRRGSWPASGAARHAARLVAAFAPQGDTAAGVRHQTAAGPLESLSARELEVLRLLDQGLSNQQIADRLYLGLGTVKTHLHNIYAKLAVRDRRDALLAAHDQRLL